ncbi:MBL fold metallo-hydrolase [Amorphus orientalis]|uniref:Glyoxylase-like metal-dependent hydrolase (Beta-lactamase superfamily II) n=1 Tax=Amorphus orientalis TaxID=649198 RepID=A0AAE3VPR1_9HYPH|nr:MBL fold metallo-hydrolase [Amorphus orientalis]MDQ0316569.1 glyoxylase-like metal-dependent hydrolase (beta-lactamase superfamily II) [Amorphus orientalis]
MSTPLKFLIVPVTPFQQNCSIACCTSSNRSAIIDPGGDIERIRQAISESGSEPEKIILTHGHIDHAGAAAELAEELGLPIEGPHEADKFLLDDLVSHGGQLGIPARPVAPDRWVDEGGEVTIGDCSFSVMHIPGHTPGHVVYLFSSGDILIGGDVLFAGSVGRTDFPYGDHDALISGIREKLMPLSDDTIVLTGHGQATTIGRERQANPFLKG